MMAVASVFYSCKKENPEDQIEKAKQECAAQPGENFWNDDLSICQHNTTYTFNQDDSSNIDPTDKIKASADSASVCNVYLVPTGQWMNFSGKNISAWVERGLKPAIGVSPKVRGKGNFEFKPGVIEQSDSLWLVQQGWTVNKQH
jgi:hypothetical protein